MNIRLILAIFATTLVCAMQAAVSFSYQGCLKDAQGKALSSKNQTIEFRLYNGPSATQVLWGRSIGVLLDDAGLFNVELSDSSGGAIAGTYATLKETLLATADTTLYIGVKVVGSSGEIRPRQRILSVPFATVAGDVKSTSSDLGVGGKMTAAAAQVNGQVSAQSVEVTTGGLKVSGGEAKFASKVSVTSGGLNVTGSATFNDSVTMKSTLDVASKINVDGNPVPVAIKGMVIMWYGDANKIPSGWKLCDGNNGTPNLCGRFVAGAKTGDEKSANSGDYNVYNATARGANSVSLTTAQMPSHNHTYLGDDSINNVQTAVSGTYQTLKFDMTSSASTKGGKYTTSNAGGGGAHENRPEFLALYYIMYTGN